MNRSNTVTLEPFAYGTKKYAKAVADAKAGLPVEWAETHFFASWQSAAAWLVKNRKRISSKFAKVDWTEGDSHGVSISHYERWGDSKDSSPLCAEQDFWDCVQNVLDSKEAARKDAEYLAGFSR